ncbi:hypothetical protein V6N12_022731 [Hibiscus sabdariffa]|uniref:Uncharacterized protein n=1 Tax=Hibiscus sabdariffa TaxID=183260 RepID=A0ABR2FVJ8_9ROSI
MGSSLSSFFRGLLAPIYSMWHLHSWIGILGRYSSLLEDMEIWDMIGFWHYPIPGFFLLAQFCLGILVALGNLVNNSVFLYLSDEAALSSNNCTVEGMKIYILSAILFFFGLCI